MYILIEHCQAQKNVLRAKLDDDRYSVKQILMCFYNIYSRSTVKLAGSPTPIAHANILLMCLPSSVLKT